LVDGLDVHVEDDAIVAAGLERSVDCRLLGRCKRVVRQATAGAADERNAGEDDVGGDSECDQRSTRSSR
jgi:hypothetical protein